MQRLYRGIWADRLENREELPIGGSLFSDELTIRILLDFDDLPGSLDDFRSPRDVSGFYAQNRPAVQDWLSKVHAGVDPYLFYVAHLVARKTQDLLDVRPDQQPSREERLARFTGRTPRLTELRGLAFCAEQAAVGQYLLQQVLEEDYSSAYMSGVAAGALPERLEDHSFIVVKGPTSPTYIYDISRPHLSVNVPRFLEPAVPFTPALFSGTQNLLVPAREAFQGETAYFGVGHPQLLCAPKILDQDGHP